MSYLKINNILCGILSLVALTGGARAEDKNTQVYLEIQRFTEEIQKEPDNAKLYVKRSALYNLLGMYTKASQDLAKQCELEVDDQIRELCEFELKEYKNIHSIQ